MQTKLLSFILFLLALSSAVYGGARVEVGIEQLMQGDNAKLLKGRRIGLITNHTAISSTFRSSIDILKEHAKEKQYQLVALFAAEHGIDGSAYAYQTVEEGKDRDNIPIFSLYGDTKRPTDEMLKNIDMLIFDMQDIGSRSYTYINTMFYSMEEAAKRNIPFVVLDRPNPINGTTVDGPMVDDAWRSPFGYINVPYCHGMTVGELARFFNVEQNVNCKLHVVPMKGWKRSMSFRDTGLPWIPTSPYIPEMDTPFYYPTTGILGELQIVNTGIGYTMPFKLIGAPWIDAEQFADRLNSQKFPGVYFQPFYFKPMYGRYAKEECEGVLILVTDPATFKPMRTQYLIIGMLKSLYPVHFEAAIKAIQKHKEKLCKLNGSEEIPRILVEEKNVIWKLCAVQEKGREEFMKKRQKYLMREYAVQ